MRMKLAAGALVMAQLAAIGSAHAASLSETVNACATGAAPAIVGEHISSLGLSGEQRDKAVIALVEALANRSDDQNVSRSGLSGCILAASALVDDADQAKRIASIAESVLFDTQLRSASLVGTGQASAE